ncbi:hypothetical protein SAMN05216522_107116 [Rosenbergiella nectarea]|uniref:Uncharacterized protein n=1 Tax=Rosenbergiella nectarea TaxID=988801 RepID=A0A1H9JCH5_9GAMM|nr:hypothetical protein [Rosenbergiella nectarea]SEQ84550.1 hypothetical protein SAMN05216522_107116 [Rosenbergiella nectarea]
MENKKSYGDITGGTLGLGCVGKGVATEIPNLLSYQRTITIEETQEFIFSNDDLNKHKVGDISGSAIGLGNLKESGEYALISHYQSQRRITGEGDGCRSRITGPDCRYG